MIELSAFDTKTRADDGVDIELKDIRTGKGAGVFIKVIGTDGDRFAALATERARAIREHTERHGEPAKADADRFTAELLAGCTLGWRGLSKDGAPLEFSHSAAMSLYLNYPAIREQINAAIANRANFLLA